MLEGHLSLSFISKHYAIQEGFIALHQGATAVTENTEVIKNVTIVLFICGVYRDVYL